MNIQEVLNQIGLEEKEAKVYLAALELGPTTIQDITRKSGINRTTVYQALKNLKAQNLASQTIAGKRKLILASDPASLKQNIKRKEYLLNSIFPELITLSNLNPVKPKIRFYEGREGHREIYRETLKSKDKTLYWISPINTQMETIGEDFLDFYIKERVAKKIFIKLIQKTSPTAPAKYNNPATFKKELKDVRYLPQEMDLPNIIAIFENKVAVMSTQKEGFGFIIESADYTKSMKVFYELLWNISKPYGETTFSKKAEPKKDNEIDNYWK